jgi:hypothetical protein
MADWRNANPTRQFSALEGLALTLSYLEDPASVSCPCCGPGLIEVIGFVDPPSLDAGEPRPVAPENDYTVILFCHGCTRAAAIYLSYRERHESREAA